MNKQEQLNCGEIYHIYNRAVGSEKLFIWENDYKYFLKKLERFILPIACLYAYCLIPNHFHLLIKIKEVDEIDDLQKLNDDDYTKYLIKVFGNFFNSYTKSFNKVHRRMGRLFIQPFKRIIVPDEDYFVTLVNYIHRNPIHHGLVSEYTDWKYSSYQDFLTNAQTNINRNEVLSYFNSLKEFITYHEDNKTKPGVREYFLES